MESFKVADLEIFPETFCVKRDGKTIPLNLSEFKILHLLAKNSGYYYSKNAIYKHVWGKYPRVEPETVKVYISTIRKKLGGNYIQTMNFAGYKFMENI